MEKITKIGSKLVNNILVRQSDWEEQDQTSTSYIQNKPEDVPSDDKVYGRQNKEWVEIKADNADWEETNPEAASYIKNKPEDAPQDGTIYGRCNGEWVETDGDSWKNWSEEYGSSGDGVYIGKDNQVDVATVIGDENTSFGVNTFGNSNTGISENYSADDKAFKSYIIGDYNESIQETPIDYEPDNYTSITIGTSNAIDGEGINIGKENTATKFAINIGQKNEGHDASIVIGENNKANNGDYIFGKNVTADKGTFVIGSTIDAQEGSIVIGKEISADEGGIAIGKYNLSASNGAFAFGGNGVTADNGSFVAGIDSVSAGSGAVAVGRASIIADNGSVAIGSTVQAVRNQLNTDPTSHGGSVAIGKDSYAYNGGIAIGKSLTAHNGNNSHGNSVAIGLQNNVRGTDAQAIGKNITINGNSLAVGDGLIASGDNHIMFGRYNNSSGSETIVVGKSLTALNGMTFGTNNSAASQGLSIGTYAGAANKGMSLAVNESNNRYSYDGYYLSAINLTTDTGLKSCVLDDIMPVYTNLKQQFYIVVNGSVITISNNATVYIRQYISGNYQWIAATLNYYYLSEYTTGNGYVYAKSNTSSATGTAYYFYNSSYYEIKIRFVTSNNTVVSLDEIKAMTPNYYTVPVFIGTTREGNAYTAHYTQDVISNVGKYHNTTIDVEPNDITEKLYHSSTAVCELYPTHSRMNGTSIGSNVTAEYHAVGINASNRGKSSYGQDDTYTYEYILNTATCYLTSPVSPFRIRIKTRTNGTIAKYSSIALGFDSNNEGATATYGSFAVGMNVSACNNGMAYGKYVTATNGSFTYGMNGTSANNGGFAYGYNAAIADQGSFTFGYSGPFASCGSFAMGYNSITANYGSFAIGMNGTSAGNGSFAIGNTVFANNGGYILGRSTVSAEDDAYAIGSNMLVAKVGSIAIGRCTVSAENDAYAFGSYSITAKNGAIALGRCTVSAEDDSYAFGSYGLSAKNGGIAIGRNRVLASGGSIGLSQNGDTYSVGGSITIGTHASAVGASIAIAAENLNYYHTSAMDASVAIGRGNLYSTNGSMALGVNTTATFGALAYGAASVSANYGSMALGMNSLSADYGSFAFGGYNTFATHGSMVLGRIGASAYNGSQAFGGNGLYASDGSTVIGVCATALSASLVLNHWGGMASAINGSVSIGPSYSNYASTAIGRYNTANAWSIIFGNNNTACAYNDETALGICGCWKHPYNSNVIIYKDPYKPNHVIYNNNTYECIITSTTISFEYTVDSYVHKVVYNISDDTLRIDNSTPLSRDEDYDIVGSHSVIGGYFNDVNTLNMECYSAKSEDSIKPMIFMNNVILGAYNSASHYNSFILGNNNTTLSVATDGDDDGFTTLIGFNNSATKNYAMAIGENNFANASQLVVGRFNEILDGTDDQRRYDEDGNLISNNTSGALFIVGNGTYTDNDYADIQRSNAMVVYADGSVSSKNVKTESVYTDTIVFDEDTVIDGTTVEIAGDEFINAGIVDDKLTISVTPDLAAMLTSLSGLLSTKPSTGTYTMGVVEGTLTWIQK